MIYYRESYFGVHYCEYGLLTTRIQQTAMCSVLLQRTYIRYLRMILDKRTFNLSTVSYKCFILYFVLGRHFEKQMPVTSIIVVIFWLMCRADTVTCFSAPSTVQ